MKCSIRLPFLGYGFEHTRDSGEIVPLYENETPIDNGFIGRIGVKRLGKRSTPKVPVENSDIKTLML